MKAAPKVLAVLILLVVLVGGGGVMWADGRTSELLSQTYEVHDVDFPIPFPLDAAEVAALGLSDEEASALALERAIQRGDHLVHARYACMECHGENFGGYPMVDDKALGTIYGPNLTNGSGSRTLQYSAADWDHIVRHGVKPDGTPAIMPSEEVRRMSDQELSDIAAYIRSIPPVEGAVPPMKVGPLAKVLVAVGKFPLAANTIPHGEPHPTVPPEATVSVEFGKHLAGTCMGCHRSELNGGPVPAGDPAWPPAGNLTPHESGLGTWSYDDFVTALRQGTRPDGSTLQEPMANMRAMVERMTDTELEALWMYLRSVPAAPTGS